MRISPLLLLPAVLVLVLATRASADELSEQRERIEQLEATVEELSLQLADSVRERRRLEAELAEAVAAAAAAATTAGASKGSVDTPAEVEAEVGGIIEEIAVAAEAGASPEGSGPATAPPAVAESAYTRSADCDVAQALAGYDGKRKGNEALEAWLEADDHLNKCSTAQLQEIRDAVKWDWLGYEKPVLKILDRELARR